MNTLCYDVFELIIGYLDPKSIVNLIFTNKYIHSLYKNNQSSSDDIIIRCILNQHNVWYPKQHKVPQKDRSNGARALYKAYLGGADHIMCYIKSVQNVENDSTFEFLLKLAKLRRQRSDFHVLCHGDVGELLFQCPQTKVQHMLAILSGIPSGVLCYSMLEILHQGFDDKVEKKLEVCFKHLFAKHFYSRFSNDTNAFLHQVLHDIVVQGRVSLLMYFVLVKSKYPSCTLHYSNLINTAVEYDQASIVKLLYEEHVNDNKRRQEPVFVLVKPASLLILCSNGGFDTLRFVVECMLGRFINTTAYIDNIQLGLNHFVKKRPSMREYINHFLVPFLKQYLTWENYQKLCQ
jgi:hypothetical protein